MSRSLYLVTSFLQVVRLKALQEFERVEGEMAHFGMLVNSKNSLAAPGELVLYVNRVGGSDRT